MAEDFGKAVKDGLKLAKRVYLGKDKRTVAPPTATQAMDRSPDWYLPSAPMVYAVIHDPRMVDNPDMPSYQPYVHGTYDPPALIPLQMMGVNLEVDCFVDIAVIIVSGTWRVHCVMGSRSCDCRIAVPMGDQGSILGVEVDIPTKSYSTQLIGEKESKGIGKIAEPKDGGFLKPHIFTLTIPQIDGGTNISIKLRWSQKLLYNEGQFSLTVPFSFPEYVTPAIKKISKKEKIQLDVNSSIANGVLCKATSHPLKEISHDEGKFSFLYEADILKWSETDFSFSYSVSSGDIFGGILLQSPSLYDYDQRDMFCIYLFPGSQQSRKMFRKEVVFVVDISDSMQGSPLESTKNAISEALSKLSPEDSFDIIAFSRETLEFSTSMELASEEAIQKATDWIRSKDTVGGVTNLFTPLQKAADMLSKSQGSIPMIFLVTDGSVEDDRKICHWMQKHLPNQGSLCPSIHTFGIGSFCNHYFLRMLSIIGRGEYGSALDLDSIEVQMKKLFSKGLSTVLANVTIDALDDHENVEVYSSRIPNLSLESPLTICGRFQGSFPEFVEVKGILGDFSNFIMDLEIQRPKYIPLDRIFARQQIDLLTARTWFTEDKQLEEKVAKWSLLTCNISEYTRMLLLEKHKIQAAKPSTAGKKKGKQKKSDPPPETVELEFEPGEMILLQSISVGFGNPIATAENILLGSQEEKLHEVAEIFIKATSNCWGWICNRCCCCMGCIRCCSKINNQCGIVLAQLCTAFACISCFNCCSKLCCPGRDE